MLGFFLLLSLFDYQCISQSTWSWKADVPPNSQRAGPSLTHAPFVPCGFRADPLWVLVKLGCICCKARCKGKYIQNEAHQLGKSCFGLPLLSKQALPPKPGDPERVHGQLPVLVSPAAIQVCDQCGKDVGDRLNSTALEVGCAGGLLLAVSKF